MGDETQVQNPPQDDDLLEKLLAGAAQREADKKMKELESKGVVTKAELSTVLKEFGVQLTETITSAMTEQLTKSMGNRQATEAELPDNKGGEGEPMQKGQRKGTIQGGSNPRDDNPIRYLIQKSRSGQEFDDVDKAIVWALTEQGLKQGMVYKDAEVPDFGEDSTY